MKRVVVYARYSSDSQTEQSIEGQLRVCEEYALKNNMVIVQTYIDRAISGITDNRPDFKRMLNDAKNKDWDSVLVYRLDRFSRNKYESVIHKKALKDLGINVVSAMEAIPDTPEGIILESLLEGLNQYYSAELSQKVKRGLRENRLKGRFQGGIDPYGYNVVNHKLEINLDEAKVIKYIFKHYILGLNGMDIARKLNKRKIKYYNSKFNSEIIYRVISRQYYTGIYIKNDEVYDNYYPQIIDPQTFKKAKDIRESKRYGRGSNSLYELRNKIYCKYCGSKYCAEAGTGLNGRRIKYYICSGRKRLHKCNAISYTKEFLEEYVCKILKNFISNSEDLLLLSTCILKRYKKNKNIDIIKDLELQNFENKQILNNLYIAIEKGVFSENVNERIKELELKIKENEAIISMERRKALIRHTIPYIKNFYKQALDLKSIQFFYYLVKRIDISDTAIELYLETPYGDEFKDIELVKCFRYKESFCNYRGSIYIDKNVKIFV